MNKLNPKWKNEESIEHLNVIEVSTLKNEARPTEIGIYLDLDNDNYSKCSILGIALNMNCKHLYIRFEDAINDEALKSILKDPTIKKYTYDFKAIKVALANNNIEINGLYFDILIASYLIDSSLNFLLNAESVKSEKSLTITGAYIPSITGLTVLHIEQNVSLLTLNPFKI